MIKENSRYYLSDVDHVAFEDGGAKNPIVLYNFDDLSNVSYSIHTYIDGERLDQIAARYYNNRCDLWWFIAEYNPEVRDFFNIPAGTLLRIPNV